MLLHPLPRPVPHRDRPRIAPHRRPPGSGPTGVYPLGTAAPLRALAALGCRGPRDQLRFARHPQHGRWRDQWARHEDYRRSGPDALRRPPGPWRADAPLGGRQECQGIPRHDGPQAGRGHLQCGRGGAYRWSDSVQSEAEVRIWVADGIANGLRPWFSKFSGTLHDRRWLDVVEDFYRWHHRVETYLRNEAPLARVGLVYSQQTAWFYGGTRARAKVEDPALGWYQALIEARIPFEMVHDRLLDVTHFGEFKTLILPNIAALSDEQCRQLREFVERGGGLVATYETSLYDEWGARRKDFGLADLFGVSFRSKVEGPICNAYLRLENDPTGKRHPLLDGLDDASRIIHGTSRLEVTPRHPFPHPPLTLIPSYPDLPMEMVYPAAVRTEVPEVYLSKSAHGRVVYFPWDIDRVFWDVLAVEHGILLRNAVRWATDEEPPVEVKGPGVLDVTVWRQQRSMTVHLVNLTNPMMMKGPFRELIPVGEQQVVVRLPEEVRARRVQLLREGRELPVQQDANRLSLKVPSIRDIEIVAIDLESL